MLAFIGYFLLLALLLAASMKLLFTPLIEKSGYGGGVWLGTSAAVALVAFGIIYAILPGSAQQQSVEAEAVRASTPPYSATEQKKRTAVLENYKFKGDSRKIECEGVTGRVTCREVK